MTFEEWRQSDDAWAWPAGKGEPDLDTMLRRAWDAGIDAENKRVMDVIDGVDRWNCKIGNDVNNWDLSIEIDDIKKCLNEGLDAFIERYLRTPN